MIYNQKSPLFITISIIKRLFFVRFHYAFSRLGIFFEIFSVFVTQKRRVVPYRAKRDGENGAARQRSYL